MVKRRKDAFADMVPYDIPGIEYKDAKGNSVRYLTTLTYEQVQALISPFLLSALSLFSDFSVCGLPHGMYSEERNTVKEILKIIKCQCQEYDDWEREREKRD